jgi:cyanophycinase
VTSVTLVGGGWGGDPRVWRPFLEAAAAHASGGAPRVAVVVVRDDDGQEHADRLVAAIRAAGPVEPVTLALPEDGVLDPALLPDDLDGLVIGGGLTPAYRTAVVGAAARIRTLVRSGTAYAGFSAGSAIAPSRAVVGGWLAPSGHPVVDEEVAEDLDDLAVVDGVGLVPFAVDVHAAQWGTLARLLVAVELGLVPRGVAIDEDTAVVLRDGAAEVVGRGSAWWVDPGDSGVLVRREAGR